MNSSLQEDKNSLEMVIAFFIFRLIYYNRGEKNPKQNECIYFFINTIGIWAHVKEICINILKSSGKLQIFL